MILDHPRFKVFYKPSSGYEIHTPSFDPPQISRPSELEEILLNHLQREVLAELDRAALQREFELDQEGAGELSTD